MRERPILFSTPMVQAILSGNKDTTRRVMKNQDVCRFLEPPYMEQINELYRHILIEKCPYGTQDRLWVRETWQHKNEDPAAFGYIYKADHTFPQMPASISIWQPSIFMPRTASRITLEIMAVGVERLQDITEEDAHKEGIDMYKPSQWDVPFMAEVRSLQYKNGKDDSLAVAKFAHLWNAINSKKYPWVSNPWVWVISFRITEA